MAAQRTFRLRFLGDQGSLQIRGELLNLFNRVNLANPVSDLSNLGQFGHSESQNPPRQYSGARPPSASRTVSCCGPEPHLYWPQRKPMAGSPG